MKNSKELNCSELRQILRNVKRKNRPLIFFRTTKRKVFFLASEAIKTDNIFFGKSSPNFCSWHGAHSEVTYPNRIRNVELIILAII